MKEWIFEYEELMFGPKHDIDSMEIAAEIKFQHMPKKVYKYRCFCNDHKKALEKGVLYSSGPDKLNDFKEANLVLSDTGRRRFAQKAYDDLRIRYGLPKASVSSCMDIVTIIECYYRKQASGLYRSEPVKMPDILLQNLKESLNRAMEIALDNYCREMRDTYQICSFSATNRNELMWTHYAEGHRGFCIEYDFKSRGIRDDLVQLLFPVIYEEDTRFFIDDIDQFNTSDAMYAFTRKGTDWEYEEEWRIFFLGGREKQSQPQVMPKPSAVYLGQSVEPKNVEWMKDFCFNREMKLYQMQYNSQCNSMEGYRIN